MALAGVPLQAHDDAEQEVRSMHGRWFLGIVGLLAASCGSEPAANGPGPPPGDMCVAPQTPIVAAYDRSNGDLLWVSCSDTGGMFIVTAASDDTVWVHESVIGTFAFDAATGDEVGRSGADAPPAIPEGADRWLQSAPTIDGVSLSGGQDDPLRGSDPATGNSWERVGYIVYDDVWAAGDGAVFAVAWDTTGVEPGAHIVAYNVADGSLRWQIDQPASQGWPWHVEGQQLFVLWWGLEVRSTTDGSLVWATDYPDPESGYPRMFGAVANADTVFVSFTSIASGGD